MEDVNNPSQSTDVEQTHHPVNHSRPFFYVQPPSQPYFMYQWPMDPFGQYGFPGPALPFGRPYLAPYQYMQCPGYMVPHAPMQPNDYRRVTPLFPSVASYDLRFSQHIQQMSMHRETTSSEAQTEPRDPVGKLVNSLDGLQTCEKSGAVRESNAMLSSTPAVLSYSHEVEKLNCGDAKPAPGLAKMVEGDEVMPTTLNDSAVYDAEASHGKLEECVLSGVLPLDSSSIHEEGQNLKKNDQKETEAQFFQSERSDSKTASNDLGNKSILGPEEVQDSGTCVSEISEKSQPCEGKTTEQGEQVETLPPDPADVLKPLLQVIDCELQYQILRLPSNKTTTGLLLQNDVDPLVYLDDSSMLPAKRFSLRSVDSYSYYPQVIQERQSVLSPSLDELSSREMFSTDVEDELIAGQVYVGGDKRAETSSVPTCSNELRDDSLICIKTCICCGASLPDEDETTLPEHYNYPEKEMAQMYDQDSEFELEDAEEPITYQSQKSVLRQHTSRHGQSPCGRQAAKHKARKVQEFVEVDEQDQDHGSGECGEQLYASAKMDQIKGKGLKGAQTRSYSEHQWRSQQREVMDQESWTSCNSKPRSRPCRQHGEKARPGRRRPSCKMLAQQRPRRNEYDQEESEFSYYQRGRGSMKRRGTRY